MSCVCGDWFFDDPNLESPSPKPVYQLGPERIGPFTCPGAFLFIGYIFLLCCFSNWCERTLCMVGAVFQTALPLSDRQASCRACGSSHLGSYRCQSCPGSPRDSPGSP